MAYTLSAIRRSDKGFSFDLLDGKNVAMVHFLYEQEALALSAVEQIRVAVADAKLIKPQLV
jgi:hypothetical protein